jgi:hypothetical protein
VGGVDTHRDSNVAAVVDMNGGALRVESFPTTAAHRYLSSWMSRSARSNESGSTALAPTEPVSPAIGSGVAGIIEWLFAHPKP